MYQVQGLWDRGGWVVEEGLWKRRPVVNREGVSGGKSAYLCIS